VNLESELDLQQRPGYLDIYLDDDQQIKHFLEYPSDDVEVNKQEKRYRTLEKQSYNPNDLPCGLSSCIRSFIQEDCTISRKYEKFQSGKLSSLHKEKASDLETSVAKQMFEGEDDASSNSSTPTNDRRGSWSSNVVELQSSPPDQILENLLESVPQDEVDQKNTELRGKDRVSELFTMYTAWQSPKTNAGSPTSIEEGHQPIEVLPEPPIATETFGYRLLLKCLSLEMEVDIEPMFVTIALYDAKHKKKISENFYTDLNSDTTKKLYKPNLSDASISSLARSCILSVSNPSHDVYIVIKLEKILQQGDITECSEPYVKDATDKCRDKAKQNAKWFCERLGHYRMPFAWTTVHFMNTISDAVERYQHLVPQDDATSPESPLSPGVDERTSNTLESKFQFQTLSRKCKLSEKELNMLTTFKPATLTISQFFKQVRVYRKQHASTIANACFDVLQMHFI
jgi:hypothetical protein